MKLREFIKRLQHLEEQGCGDYDFQIVVNSDNYGEFSAVFDPDNDYSVKAVENSKYIELEQWCG